MYGFISTYHQHTWTYLYLKVLQHESKFSFSLNTYDHYFAATFLHRIGLIFGNKFVQKFGKMYVSN